MSIKAVKIISACLTVVGVAVNLATTVLSDKLLDNKIETKVSEALSNK